MCGWTHPRQAIINTSNTMCSLRALTICVAHQRMRPWYTNVTTRWSRKDLQNLVLMTLIKSSSRWRVTSLSTVSRPNTYRSWRAYRPMSGETRRWIAQLMCSSSQCLQLRTKGVSPWSPESNRKMRVTPYVMTMSERWVERPRWRKHRRRCLKISL